MKIAVLGSGAMGCYFGGYLSEKNEVIFIDKLDSVVDSINQNGVRIEEVDGKEKNFLNVKAYKSGTCPEKVDLVIVLVKTTYTEETLIENRDLFLTDTKAITLQNGAGNDRKIAKFVDSRQIVIGTTTNNCVNLGLGHIRHSGMGKTIFGSNEGNMDILNLISSLFSVSGLDNEISTDIQRVIWRKLFVNLSINSFTALIQTPIGYMAKNEYAWNFAKRLIYEAVEVAEADGTYFDRREVLEYVHKVIVEQGNGYSSMYQDRQRKNKMEIDSINGMIVEQAKKYGVPTPYNALIVDLIHAVEGAYEFYK